MLRFLVIAALSAAAIALPKPRFTIDGHVHLTNISLFNYSWGNASAGTCPCAPPCLCDWTIPEWQVDSASASPDKFVFVEVAAAASQWLEEAEWVQLMARNQPLSFGSASVPAREMDALLGRLAALPLVHGVRPGGIDWAGLTEASFAALVAHARLLEPHGLSFDVIGPMGAPGVAQWVARLVQAVPPGTRFIIDHFGSPPVLGNASAVAAWRAAMQVLAAASPDVVLKAGGLLQYYEAGGALPSVAQMAPFATAGLQAFGWDRSLVEYNWYSPPEMANYAVWQAALVSILDAWPQPLTQPQVDALFGGTAARVYRVSA